jgi:hypothetical protein
MKAASLETETKAKKKVFRKGERHHIFFHILIQQLNET